MESNCITAYNLDGCGGVLGVVSWIGYMMATTSAKPASTITDDD